AGWKICDISKRLCVTHSCVSKILNRYRQTGSVRPKDAKEGRTESPLVTAVRDYRTRLGMSRQGEIREQLIKDGICTRETAPTYFELNWISSEEKRRTNSRSSQRRIPESLSILTRIITPYGRQHKENTRNNFARMQLHIAPKQKGVIAQSVKEVTQSLVDDGLVECEKIGTFVCYWAFPSKALQTRKRKLKDLEESVRDLEAKINDGTAQLKELRKGKE
ncbi:paired box' domain protein, partial [Ostertagia ostertagi]